MIILGARATQLQGRYSVALAALSNDSAIESRTFVAPSGVSIERQLHELETNACSVIDAVAASELVIMVWEGMRGGETARRAEGALLCAAGRSGIGASLLTRQKMGSLSKSGASRQAVVDSLCGTIHNAPIDDNERSALAAAVAAFHLHSK